MSGSTDDIAPVPGPAESSDDDAVPDLDVADSLDAGDDDVPPDRVTIPPMFPMVDEDALAAPEDARPARPEDEDARAAAPATSDTDEFVENEVGAAGSQQEAETTIDPAHDIPHLAVDLGTRPCVYCGRAVPQRGESSPPVRYCLDNDGACARAAADRRRRDQDDPGLAGQVARTWDMVERLEDVAELLAMSLTGGLSVVGVERRIAEARAEVAAEIAHAQQDREAARREAELVLARVGAANDRARRAETEAAEMLTRLESMRVERDTARDMGAQATRTAEAANSAIVVVSEERDRMTRRIAELTSALDVAREEAVRQGERLVKEAQKRGPAVDEARSRLRAAESELDRMRTTAEIAQNARAAAEQACAEADRQALEARAHAEEMSAARDEAVAELDACRTELGSVSARLADGEHLAADLEESRAGLLEAQVRTRERDQMLDQLRGTLATMLSERDAARADADEARATLEHMLRSRLGPPTEPRLGHVGEQEATPPPGPFPSSPPGHDLGGVAGPPDLFRRRFPPPEE